ncbi:MAG: N-6 DNA methylase [Candidatus Doudnabacteria bacterium]
MSLAVFGLELNQKTGKLAAILLDNIMNESVTKKLYSTDYRNKLPGLVLAIKRRSETAENEATVVSSFELNLFSFINNELGLKYYPEKEKFVGTERHIAQGRIDSKYGAFVIEFKHPSKLKTSTLKEKASSQLEDYLRGLNVKNPTDYLGLVTDGVICRFIRSEGGQIYTEAWMDISPTSLDRLVKTIILLEQIALTSDNLIRDFCEPLDDNLAKQLTKVFYKTLLDEMKPKTEMLFEEWQELFKLSHDDTSQQRDLQDRRKELSTAIDVGIKTNREEYLALYALQTTYALIVKLIAFKVVSKIYFNKNIFEFGDIAQANSAVLQMKMLSLEDGEIFRTIGINNLLEGDYFSWYASKQQWSKEIHKKIVEVVQVLSKYEDKVLVHEQVRTHDLFKELYQHIVPSKVRHSLGEFYTPAWLADNLVLESISQLKKKDNWRMLDPTSGSGTFLIVGIQKVLEETQSENRTDRIKEILSRVKGIDLNPLSVLTGRVNYFINTAHLIEEGIRFNIPIYLGDSSYVPEPQKIKDVECLGYHIKTLKGSIDIVLPKSVVSNTDRFSQTMTEIEYDIKSLDWSAVATKIKGLANSKELIPEISEKIDELAKKFIDLEKNEWNGIWARIVTNFLTTASLGRFELIVGNPPWIDWRNLPEGYRNRIKSLCIERHLFSGDGLTGGINLNVCALIANVAADNWLNKNGILAFLMPQNLMLLQTYEGFRNFYLSNGERLYFQNIFDWTKAGHPFQPVQHKFLTYFISDKVTDYEKGIDVSFFIKKSGNKIEKINEHIRYDEVRDSFRIEHKLMGQCIKGSTNFSYADSSKDLEQFRVISGKSSYIGREGVEFYPQELFLFEIDDEMPKRKNEIYLNNYQNEHSKHKIPAQDVLFEKMFVYPLIKGINIERYHLNVDSEFVVPFPYEKSFSTRVPLILSELRKKSPNLAKYILDNKAAIEAQTAYNEKIIGKREKEFYALARVGAYSFAKTYVTFRDNTKWQAAVVEEIETDWGGKKRPVFQNHAVSMCEREDGEFISTDEAHFVCAILNAPITQRFITNSSDSRSFKIRPPVFIPRYSKSNQRHKQLSDFSKLAHKNYSDEKTIINIDKMVNQTYLEICRLENK